MFDSLEKFFKTLQKGLDYLKAFAKDSNLALDGFLGADFHSETSRQQTNLDAIVVELEDYRIQRNIDAEMENLRDRMIDGDDE